MATQPALELTSDKTTAEIVKEAAGMLGLVDVQLPLTLKGWDLVEMAAENAGRPVVLRSADGDVFVGEINDADEGKYLITVELS